MDSLVSIFSNNEAWYLMLIASFLGGILASISPCSLAMIPLIIGYIGGFSKETPAKTLLQLFCFIFGTAIVFTLIGTICALTGQVFATAFGGYFTIIIASFLLVMGLKLLELLDFNTPSIIKSIPKNSTNSIIIYPLLLGIIFIVIGLVMLINPDLFYDITEGWKNSSVNTYPSDLYVKSIRNTAIMFLFAIGQGFILLIAGLFTSSLKRMQVMASFTEVLLKISGALLILVSIYLYWKTFSPLL